MTMSTHDAAERWVSGLMPDEEAMRLTGAEDRHGLWKVVHALRVNIPPGLPPEDALQLVEALEDYRRDLGENSAGRARRRARLLTENAAFYDEVVAGLQAIADAFPDDH